MHFMCLGIFETIYFYMSNQNLQLYHCMEDLDQSLDGESQWVYYKKPMQESLVATSEKVYFQNASAVNRTQLENSKKHLKAVSEQPLQDTQNEFLEVGKWRKNKESAISQEMASVKNEVQQIMTKTKWKEQKGNDKEKEKEKEKQKEKEEFIADESICPDEVEEEKNEQAIEDQTQQEDEQQEEQEEEQQEEQEEQQEQQEQQQEEQQEEQEQEQQQEEASEQEQEESNAPSKSHEYDDDKTDTQSQMKRTEYLPSKWTKKRQSQGPNNSSPSDNAWQRKQAILKRILILIK